LPQRRDVLPPGRPLFIPGTIVVVSMTFLLPQKCSLYPGVPFLGAIPQDPAMHKAADEGRPFLIRSPGMARDNPTWKQVDAVMENIVRIVEDGKAADAPGEEMLLNPV